MSHCDWLFDDNDRMWMRAALNEARLAAARHEVPVGAVVVLNTEIIARAGNRRQELQDPSAHAEILALRCAGTKIGDWRMPEAVLYVTLEPCPMCVSACRQARLGLVVWGTSDAEIGACSTKADLAEDPRFGNPLAHRGGLLAEESRSLLKSFFAKKRNSS